MRSKKKSEAYRRGYDAGKYGATLYNSHFSIFSTPEAAKDWEKGKEGWDGRL